MSKESSSLDRLPDDLLVEILSHLPLKSAVAATVLSPRWRWMWTRLEDIQLSFDYYPIEQRDFEQLFNVVQSLLPKFTSPCIRKFSLDFGSVCYDDAILSRINTLFDWALKKQVQELSIEFEGGRPGHEVREIPLRVFQISSLVILNLRPWFFVHENHNLFSLRNLKKLGVELCILNYRVLDKIISSSPSLEDLSFTIIYHGGIPRGHHTIKLSSPCLKRLNMRLSHPIHAVIDAPKLAYLSVTNNVIGIYPHKISFVINSPTVLLDFSFYSNDHSLERSFAPCCNLFSVISGVISLSTVAHKTSPVIAPLNFTHLTHLRLLVMSELVGLDLLQQCPVLEVLSIDFSEYVYLNKGSWSLPDFPPQCLITCVKRIEIQVHSIYSETEEIVLQLVKYLLGTAKSLELLRINVARPDLDQSNGMDPKLHFINRLLDTPRSCPKCQIEFYDPGDDWAEVSFQMHL